MVFALELKLSKTMRGLVCFVPYLQWGAKPPHTCNTKYTSPLRVFGNFNAKAKTLDTFAKLKVPNERYLGSFLKRIRKLWTTVYPTNNIHIAVLNESLRVVFRHRNLCFFLCGLKHSFSHIFARLLRSYVKCNVTIRLLAICCFRLTHHEVCAIQNHRIRMHLSNFDSSFILCHRWHHTTTRWGGCLYSSKRCLLIWP